MTNLRVAKVRALVPSITALALLLGTALLTRAVRSERSASPIGLAQGFGEEESSLMQSARVAELLEQGRLEEAEPLLLALPTTPIPMDAAPGTEAFQQQAQTLTRLGKAMIQAALKQASDGKRDEAMERIRFCRALLHHHGDSPQALKVSKELESLADKAETQLQIG